MSAPSSLTAHVAVSLLCGVVAVGVAAQNTEPEVLLQVDAGALTEGSDPADTRIDIRLLVEQAGKQSLGLRYQVIPKAGVSTGQTPYRRAGDEFLLPAGWQGGESTGEMTRLTESLIDVDMWRERKTLALNYRRVLDPQWQLTADFRRDQVDGIRPSGAATGSNGGNVRSVVLGLPIERETHTAQLGLAYTGQDYGWSLGYLGSFFDNGFDRYAWATAYAPQPQWADGTGYPEGRNQLASEPENQAHHVKASAQWRLASATRLVLDGTLGRHTQDDWLLPYTINSALNVDTPLPTRSLNGRVDITRFNARVTHRASSSLMLVGRLGYDDRDNRTPIEAWQRVRGDAEDQQALAEARLNRPYSRTRERVSLDASYRAGPDWRWRAAVDGERIERDFSEVTESDEWGTELGVSSTRFESVAASLHYRHAERRADAYVGDRPLRLSHLPGSLEEDAFENHPLMRKYYLADRDRDQLRLRTDWYPVERLSAGLALAYSRDDYPGGFFGLNESRLLSWAADLSYRWREDVSLSGFLARDHYRSEQAGRSFRGFAPAEAFDPERNWWVTARDRYTSAGTTLEWSGVILPIGERRPEVDVSLSLSRSRFSGRYSTDVGPALNSEPLPEVQGDFDRLEIAARHTLSERASVALALEWEYYRRRDFALDGVAPDTVSNVLLLGEGAPRYRDLWVHLGYRYRF